MPYHLHGLNLYMASAVQEESTFTVEGAGKQRLDAFLSGQMPDASRARLQARRLLNQYSAHLAIVSGACNSSSRGSRGIVLTLVPLESLPPS